MSMIQWQTGKVNKTTFIRRKRLLRQPSKERRPCSTQSSISSNCRGSNGGRREGKREKNTGHQQEVKRRKGKVWQLLGVNSVWIEKTGDLTGGISGLHALCKFIIQCLLAMGVASNWKGFTMGQKPQYRPDATVSRTWEQLCNRKLHNNSTK